MLRFAAGTYQPRLPRRSQSVSAGTLSEGRGMVSSERGLRSHVPGAIDVERPEGEEAADGTLTEGSSPEARQPLLTRTTSLVPESRPEAEPGLTAAMARGRRSSTRVFMSPEDPLLRSQVRRGARGEGEGGPFSALSWRWTRVSIVREQ